MSQYSVRRAVTADAATITSHRRAMFADMGHTDTAQLDAMDAAFLPWVTARLERGEYLGWLARRLVQVALDRCRADGLGAVILHASDAGRPLYEALGFTPTNEMRRLLAQG